VFVTLTHDENPEVLVLLHDFMTMQCRKHGSASKDNSGVVELSNCNLVPNVEKNATESVRQRSNASMTCDTRLAADASVSFAQMHRNRRECNSAAARFLPASSMSPLESSRE